MRKKNPHLADLPHIILYSAIAAVVLYAGWAISVAYEHQDATLPAATAYPSEPGTICTADARACPDGSYVGRKGPACQFEACPVSR